MRQPHTELPQHTAQVLQALPASAATSPSLPVFPDPLPLSQHVCLPVRVLSLSSFLVSLFLFLGLFLPVFLGILFSDPLDTYGVALFPILSESLCFVLCLSDSLCLSPSASLSI